ncbi:glycosyltransferase, group 2 family protein, partial [Ostertagia ostertagi]
CQAKSFLPNLPKTSIIIVFHNEAWTTLLRTLHSVINRSPLALLEEIILIDDLSDRDYLKAPLDEYIKRFPVPMRIVHLKRRSGLIRARLTGSGMAKGRVLLFLDAHVEVTEGWLEPLVDRVARDRKRVVAPIIDVISDDTFEYVTASDTTWGGFNWHLNFRWYPVPKREMLRRKGDRSSPIQTPTIAGGLFAIDKQFFYDIGSYDEGMQVWGGENLEISFRVWMCGGSLEIHPCSRVGHVFRKQTPYTFQVVLQRLYIITPHERLRCGWTITSKFFYKMLHVMWMLVMFPAGGQLRTNLQCKNFEWYLKNIYPEAPLPYDYKSLGAIANQETKLCLDTMAKKDGPVGIQACHGAGGNQAWSLTERGEIRSDDLCLSSSGLDNLVRLERCNVASPNTKHLFKYDYENKHLVHVKTRFCVTAANGKEVVVRPCNFSAEQNWALEGYSMLEGFRRMATQRRSLLSLAGKALNGQQKRTGFIHKWNRFIRWQELDKAREEHLRERHLMQNYIRFPTGMYLTPERPEHVMPKKDLADMTRRETGAVPMELLTYQTQMRYVDHSFDNIRRYKRYRHFQHLQYDQRMIPERLLFLGPDLAAAHFLVHRGASVKFIGDDAWYAKDKSGNYSLPGTKVPGLYLEAIDASGTELMFEGFENLQNLSHLRMLRLADCPYVDDWTLSRIGGMMEGLEMLDLSGCYRVSAKGLMGLKMLKSLKYLRLEGIDCKLKVLGIDYEHELEELEANMRLLENPNVVEDARGNIFAEDDNGRLFYIGGTSNEGVRAVCDRDVSYNDKHYTEGDSKNE